MPSGVMDVDTVNGVVTLHGKVATEPEKAKAEAVARRIDGANRSRRTSNPFRWRLPFEASDAWPPKSKSCPPTDDTGLDCDAGNGAMRLPSSQRETNYR